jgi:hypothetical protein
MMVQNMYYQLFKLIHKKQYILYVPTKLIHVQCLHLKQSSKCNSMFIKTLSNHHFEKLQCWHPRRQYKKIKNNNNNNNYYYN